MRVYKIDFRAYVTSPVIESAEIFANSQIDAMNVLRKRYSDANVLAINIVK